MPAGSAGAAFVLVAPVLAGFACTWLTLAAWAGLDAHPNVFLALSLAVSAFLRLRAHASPMAWRAGDLASLLGGLVVAVLLARPFLGATPGARLALMSRTADAATHVQMVRAAARAGGYLMLRPDTELVGSRAVSHYPPAFSGLVGAFAHLSDSSALTAAVTATLVAVFVIVAVLVATSAQLAREALPEDASARLGLLVGSTAALTLLGPTALLLEDGAYAQLLALLGVLACMLLVLHGTGTATSVCLASVSVLTCQAWYLVAPALIVPWALHLTDRDARRRAATLIGVLAVPLAAFPVLAGPGTSQLHLAGFIDLPGEPALLGFGTAALASMFVLVALRAPGRVRLLLLAVVVLLLLGSVSVGLIQIAVSGSLSYYFFKVLVAAAVVAVPVIAAGVLLAAGRLRGRGRAGVITLAAAMLFGLGADPALGAAVRGSVPEPLVGGLQRSPTADEPLDAHESRAFLDSVVPDHGQDLLRTREAWLVGCSRAQDYVLSKWRYDLSLGWSPARSAVLDSLRFARLDTAALLRDRSEDPTLQAVDVYYVDRCRADVVAQLRGIPKVHLTRLP